MLLEAGDSVIEDENPVYGDERDPQTLMVNLEKITLW